MTIKVVLNGTDENQYHIFELTQNPFPQIANHKYASHLLHLAKLGGNPIPNTEYIRKHLKGYSQEFIDLCCERFEKGKIIKFNVEWKE